MRSTVRRTLLMAAAFLLGGSLVDAVLAAALVVRPPTQGLEARKPLRLEVRITADHWQGDIHIPERWGTELRTAERSSLHFRYARPSTAPTSVSYQVYRGSRPSDPGPGFRPLASGSLGAPPSTGKTREFDIDFTAFLPGEPDGRVYNVRLVGPAARGRGTTVWSNTVKITYAHHAIMQFTSPTISRVVGTRNGSGQELKQDGVPMAVVTKTFRVEGTDINEVPAETVVQILKDGKVASELRPEQSLVERLPSGETSLVLETPSSLSSGLYSVRVRTPWGTTGERAVYVGGNRPPNVGAWQLVNGGVYENHAWTEECQGIATDGSHWYISSNNDGDRALYKFTIGMQQVARHDMEQYGSEHVSALDCFDGSLYVALEQPKQLLVLPTSFPHRGDLHAVEDTWKKISGQFPWCAVNPITGDLYTSRFEQGEVTYPPSGPRYSVVYYRKAEGKKYVHAGIVSLSHSITRVQGGDITSGGKLLLVTDVKPRGGIYVYNVFTGEYYGAVTFPVENGSALPDELEGLAVSPPGTAVVKGNPVNVHLILLDNDYPSEDDVYFKHVRVPSLEDLFGL